MKDFFLYFLLMEWLYKYKHIAYMPCIVFVFCKVLFSL